MPTQSRPANRFSRPGTTTSNRSSARFGRASSPSGRSSRSSAGRVSRPTPNIGRRRAQPQQSAPKKALNAIGGLLPTAAAGKATKKTAKAGKAGKKPLGLALLAGAGALAFSQRGKLQSKLGGGSDESQVPSTTGPTYDGTTDVGAPATGTAAVTPTDPSRDSVGDDSALADPTRPTPPGTTGLGTGG